MILMKELEEETAVTGPSCPKCSARPLVMDMFSGKFPNGVVASLVYCHDCGYVLPAMMTGVEQPDKPGPRLVG